MNVLTVDEQNKKRIQEYLQGPWTFLYGYDSDIELLEQSNQLTERFAQKIFEDIIRSCHTTRETLEPNGELKEELSQVYGKFDSIPKPKDDQYYDGAYRNMDFDDVYKNMQTCFELLEIEKKHDRIVESRRIAESVIASIDATERLGVQLDTDASNDLSRIKNELEKTLQNEKTNVGFIQESVDTYNEHALQIWNEYLTNVEDGKENQFKYLIHNCSKGEIKEDFRTRVLSSSLITDKAMGVFGGKSRYGLIIKPKHIISADYQDTYTFNERKEGQELFNIKPPIRLPQEIEEICINQTIEANGEMLNYDKANIYSEIAVDEYEVVGIYYISNGEKELSPDYDRAKRMADARGLDLKELDISKCRQDNGLELMTEESQKEFCRTILYKYCCADEKLKKEFFESGNSFVEMNYKGFYEKYVNLRENSKYTADDILKSLKETIIDFDVKRWKMYDMYSEGFFVGEMSTEDFQYLMDNRYNFSECKSYEEFEKMYVSLCSSLEGRLINDKLQEYIDQRFPNKELLTSARGDRTRLQKLFERGNISIDGICDEMQKVLNEQEEAKDDTTIVTGKSDETILEEKNSLDETQTVEQGIETTEKFRINEYGEIERDGNEKPQIEYVAETSDSLPKKNSKQFESTDDKKIEQEKGIEDFVTETENTNMQMQEINSDNVNLWMTRFNKWYSAIDRVSQNAKAKFIEMKTNIINAISRSIREKSNSIDKNKEQR